MGKIHVDNVTGIHPSQKYAQLKHKMLKFAPFPKKRGHHIVLRPFIFLHVRIGNYTSDYGYMFIQGGIHL